MRVPRFIRPTPSVNDPLRFSNAPMRASTNAGRTASRRAAASEPRVYCRLLRPGSAVPRRTASAAALNSAVAAARSTPGISCWTREKKSRAIEEGGMPGWAARSAARRTRSPRWTRSGPRDPPTRAPTSSLIILRNSDTLIFTLILSVL